MVRHKKEANAKNKKFAPSRPPKPRGDSSTPEKLPYKAACWDLGHCDPKRCSGKRLMQFGLMRELSIGQRFPGVIVSYALSHYLVVVLLSPAADDYASDSPNAKKILSPADRELLELHGAAVVECSWVRVKEVPWNRIGGRCERLRRPALCSLRLPCSLLRMRISDSNRVVNEQFPTLSPPTRSTMADPGD